MTSRRENTTTIYADKLEEVRRQIKKYITKICDDIEVKEKDNYVRWRITGTQAPRVNIV